MTKFYIWYLLFFWFWFDHLSSKKKIIVSLSFTEAKYVPFTSAGTQALWIREVLQEIEEKQIHPTMIFCHNMSAMKLSKNPIHNSMKKHFNLKYHFIRDLVQKKQVELKYINTQIQLADIFTKIVSKAQFFES